MNTIDLYLRAFQLQEQDPFRQEPGWLSALRKDGMSRFVHQGFPSLRQEEWRYTNLTPVAEMAPCLERPSARLEADIVKRLSFAPLDAYRLVFVNGRYAPEFSVLPGDTNVSLTNLQSACRQGFQWLEAHLGRHAHAADNPFVALNQSLFQDGACLQIPAGVQLERPVVLLFVCDARQDGTTLLPRNCIHAGRGSRATVIEHYVSLRDLASFTNAVTECVVETGASLEHCKLQRESHTGFHVATIQARQASDSRFVSHSISSGARLSRNDIRTVMEGEGADSLFNGLYLAGGTQLVDHHTVMDHVKAHCTSHEFYHGILGGQARGVFNGKIFVRPNAQKTDAKQTNKNILLSQEALVNTKPQLEIFADDVKCTHGATVGQLDDQAVFYLQTRGVGEALARHMLLHAFANDVVNRIAVPEVRTEVAQHLGQRLDGPGMLGGK